MPARAPAPLTVVLAPRTEDQPARPSREDADRREAELGRLADEEQLLREKGTVIADLCQQVQKLTKQLCVERESAGPEPVAMYANPERQFRDPRAVQLGS